MGTMSSHSGCLLSESLPSDSSSNVSQSHRKIQEKVQAQGKSHGYATMIDMLPDNVLLEIFHFCRISEFPLQRWKFTWKWGRLVHVCRRWRQIVFASPHRLLIQLRCTPGIPVREYLSYWPAFPIIIKYGPDNLDPSDEDNVIAALEHSDRAFALDLTVTTIQWAKLVAVIQKPYPALKYLGLTLDPDTPVLPRGFLVGSVPRLRKLELEVVPFPALPALLASTSDLVELVLYEIPDSGYISPEAMVTGLVASTSLRYIFIGFKSNNSHPDGISPPPVTRAVLPALTSFEFGGVSDYLEDLVARIDCPKLKTIKISYLHRRAGFRAAQLFDFVDRMEDPQLCQFRRLDVRFVFMGDIRLEVSHTAHDITTCITLCGTEWGVSHLVQLFGQFSVKLSNVRHLSIGYYREGPEISQNEWVQLLHPFTAVQTLRVCRLWVDDDPPAFEDVTGEMAIEADTLPALGLLCIDCPQVEFFPFFENFVAVRQLSGRPVTAVRCNWEFEERFRSYPWSYLSEEDKDPFRLSNLYIEAT